MRKLEAGLLVIVTLLSGTALVGSAPAGEPQAEKPAAESLLHSAVGMVHASPDTPARAGRLAVLVRYAARLDPRDADTCRLLAAVYESQGRLPEAAEALENCRAVGVQCHDINCHLLELLVRRRGRAEDRIALLEELTGDEDKPAGVRAVAAARLGRLHLGRGDLEDARLSYLRALELDPTNPDAAEGLLRTTDDHTPADEATAMLRLLRGNPKAVAIAWDLAAILDELGLHERALTFFEHAWDTAVAAGGHDALSAPFVTEYCNTMLNAGRTDQAARRFEPLLERFDDHLDFLALMVEARRAAGDHEQAERVARSMAEIYQTRTAEQDHSPQAVAELAWFHLVVRQDPRTALEHAQRAAEEAPKDSFVRRVLAASLVRTGRFDQARDALEQLRDRDVYAAVLLAELLAGTGESDASAEQLRSVVRRSQSGPAYRKARELAERLDVSLPPADGADDAAEVIDRADLTVLEMGRSPERFVSVELRARARRVSVGEPVVVEATLSNVGDADITLGDWGLLTPRMSFEVEMQGRRLTGLPLLTWPAPRQLAPGDSITTSHRLDVADVHDLLARRPADEITLTVHPIPDPVQTPDGVRSALPHIEAEPVTIVREPLIDPRDDLQDAWRRLTDHLDRRLAEGTIEQRMLAVRQVGSLLAAGRLPRDEYPVAGELAEKLTDDRLLEMLDKALADESPAVRAEMVAGLQVCPLDEPILSRLAPAITDPSPLVRMRAAELLGSSDPEGNRPVLQFLARDDDELVNEMAGLFAAEQE